MSGTSISRQSPRLQEWSHNCLTIRPIRADAVGPGGRSATPWDMIVRKRSTGSPLGPFRGSSSAVATANRCHIRRPRARAGWHLPAQAVTLREMSAVDVRCPSCGEANAPESRFCSSCGARLEASGGLREERKLISVLFVDLVGFTTRSDEADPEDVRDALPRHHADAKERIEHYGGTLEKFIGDAVMAVFGAPVAHGDDADRAVRAGLHVLEGIGELNRAHGLDLAARAAGETGEAVVSMSSDRGEALGIGDGVN